MGIEISYMGTKRRIAPIVADIVDSLQPGPILDAFAGMCAVGAAVAPTRPVWTNDWGVFAALVGRTLFKASRAPLSASTAEAFLTPYFECNRQALEHRFRKNLSKEERYLSTARLQDFIAGTTALPYVATDRSLESERRRLARSPHTFPYRLATITYAGSFFGVRQSIEIDSIRYAIDAAYRARLIKAVDKSWFLIALCQVVTRVNNSTGHFAQYLKPRSDNLRRIHQKRRRSIWTELLATVDHLSPIGPSAWRRGNRSFQSEAIQLLNRLRKDSNRPSVIYADPPYSKAQYSRYYHVLDTLVKYDYPRVTGTGRYPNNRLQTRFSHATSVHQCLDRLVANAASINATLVLSYPHNGLLQQRGESVEEILRRHYPQVDIAHSTTCKHSTFGASNTRAAVWATENIYLGYA